MKYVNPETGEILTENSSIEELSNLRKIYLMKVKEIQEKANEITELLRPHFEEAYEMGDKDFADYWTLSISAPKFDKKKFEAEADDVDRINYESHKDSIKEIESRYKKPGSVYLKFPRLS